MDPAKDVSFLNVGGTVEAELAAVASGRAKAFMGSPSAAVEAQRQGNHILYDLGKLNFPYLQAALFTSRAYVANNRPALVKLMQGTSSGVLRMRSDPAYAAESYKRYAKLDDDEVAKAAVDALVDSVPVPPAVSAEGLKNVVQNVATANPKAAQLDINTLADPSIADDAQKAGFGV